MKKLLLIVCVAVFTMSAQSQELRFGVKGGLNMASIGGDNASSFKGRTSFHIGGLVEIPISEKFAIQPELLYSLQGAKFSNQGATETYKLSYINVPVMAKYYIIDGLAAEAGPQFGILLSAKDDYSSQGQSGTVDIKDQLNTLDIGLGFGASYRLDMGVFFGLRYNFGLANIVSEGNAKLHNNVFQISAGYTF